MKKTLIYILIVLILAASALTVYEILRPKDTVGPVLGLVLDKSSDRAVTTVSAQIRGIRDNLLSIAEQASASGDICQAIKINNESSLARVDGLAGLDSSNQISCSTLPNMNTNAISAVDGFKKYVNDPEHNPAVSGVFTLSDDTKAISAYVPVFGAGKHYLGSIASVTYLGSIGSRLPSPDSLLSAGYVVLFDSNGDILYHFDKTLVGKNQWSDEIQNYIGHNEAINEAFRQAAQGIITNHQVPYVVRGQNRIGEFRPVPAGNDHYLVILTSLPNY